MTGALAAVLGAWGLEGARVTKAASGLIQETWFVDAPGRDRVVAQRLHPLFGATVLEDIEAATVHLEGRGVPTPRLVRTRAGALGLTDGGGRLWRVLTYLDGYTVDRVTGPPMAHTAAALVARFHAALADVAHEYRFTRAGVHDTAAHLARLEGALGGQAEGPRALAERILAGARGLAGSAFASLPRRRAHGDLKLSNVLFALPEGAAASARALIDLDTMGWMPLAFELGDAWRSWCNPLGEDVEATRFDLEIFAAAVQGYASCGAATVEEQESLVAGVQTIALELAARFCVDAFEDRYFGWDPARFPSRREHNRVRAAGQLALAEAVGARRAEAEAIARLAFRR